MVKQKAICLLIHASNNFYTESLFIDFPNMYNTLIIVISVLQLKEPRKKYLLGFNQIESANSFRTMHSQIVPLFGKIL